MRARPPQALERALPGAVDQAEPFELRGATHLLQVENPGAMAEALAAFFSRHPLG
jgi:pimeloyl-ACP methyl ester carboxylesterase